MAFTGASVENKIVVISGGGTGIGAAVARRYASEGARVAVLGRRSAPLEDVAAATGALPVVADVSDAAQTRDSIARVVDAFGAIDVLVANAGGHGFDTVGEMSDADWDASLRANLTSAFVLTRAALPQLLSTKGQVVIVSSLAGILAGPSAAGYTVGKHALIGLTRSLARGLRHVRSSGERGSAPAGCALRWPTRRWRSSPGTPVYRAGMRVTRG